MKVKLSVLNRLSLLGLLSSKGDFTTLKIIRKLKEELSFTEDEHVLLKFQPLADGRLKWDESLVPPREVEFTGIREVLLEEVKIQLRTLEEKKELKLELLELYEVLISDYKKEEEEEIQEFTDKDFKIIDS